MTRQVLKGIVKECLVEILSEGISTKKSVSKKSTHSDREERIERIKKEEQRLSEHRKKFDRKIDTAVSSLTNDDMMRDILADTARTTLQEQLAHEGNSPAGQASPGVDIGSLFDQSETNWASLAFADKKTR